MEIKKGILLVFLPVVLTICLYMVFYSKIATKPSDAGFWFIFTMGMSLGVALTRLLMSFKAEKKDK